ncbi:hypothetical protein ACH79_39410 [Bradyrhizobium sp. CCBAU 051011]|nr:hypothetical protein ACH79_39410 [Bradyrhizobium sp. CCBAU 051011]
MPLVASSIRKQSELRHHISSFRAMPRHDARACGMIRILNSSVRLQILGIRVNYHASAREALLGEGKSLST